MLLPLVASPYKVHSSENYHIAAFAKFGDLLPGCAQASKPEKECREGEFELQHKERPPRNRNKHN